MPARAAAETGLPPWKDHHHSLGSRCLKSEYLLQVCLCGSGLIKDIRRREVLVNRVWWKEKLHSWSQRAMRTKKKEGKSL